MEAERSLLRQSSEGQKQASASFILHVRRVQDGTSKYSNLFKSRLQAQRHGSIIEKVRHQAIFVLSDAQGPGQAEIAELQA